MAASISHHGAREPRQLLLRLRAALGGNSVEGTDPLRLAPAATVDALTPSAALELRGELLAGYEYDDCTELADWLLIHRERCRHRERSALVAAAERFELDGQLSAALDCARRLVDVQPESEPAHSRVMRLAYLLGDRASALQAAEACREMMRRLCDCDISEETKVLIEAIRASAEVKPPQSFIRRAIPPAVQRPPVLVGRETEWARLGQPGRAGE